MDELGSERSVREFPPHKYISLEDINNNSSMANSRAAISIAGKNLTQTDSRASLLALREEHAREYSLASHEQASPTHSIHKSRDRSPIRPVLTPLQPRLVSPPSTELLRAPSSPTSRNVSDSSFPEPGFALSPDDRLKLDTWLATWESLHRRDVELQVHQRQPSPRASVVDRYGNIHPLPEPIAHTAIVREVPLAPAAAATESAVTHASPPVPAPFAVHTTPRQLTTHPAGAKASPGPRRAGRWEKSAPATWLSLRLPSQWVREAPAVQRQRERHRTAAPKPAGTPSVSAPQPVATLRPLSPALSAPAVLKATGARALPRIHTTRMRSVIRGSTASATASGPAAPVVCVPSLSGLSRAGQSFAQLLQRDAVHTHTLTSTPAAALTSTSTSASVSASLSRTPTPAAMSPVATRTYAYAPAAGPPRTAPTASLGGLNAHALPIRAPPPALLPPLLHPHAQTHVRSLPGTVTGHAPGARCRSAGSAALRTRAFSPSPSRTPTHTQTATEANSSPTSTSSSTSSTSAPAAASASPAADTFSLLATDAALSLPVRDALASARIQAVLARTTAATHAEPLLPVPATPAGKSHPPTISPRHSARASTSRSSASLLSAEPPSSALEAAAVLNALAASADAPTVPPAAAPLSPTAALLATDRAPTPTLLAAARAATTAPVPADTSSSTPRLVPTHSRASRRMLIPLPPPRASLAALAGSPRSCSIPARDTHRAHATHSHAGADAAPTVVLSTGVVEVRTAAGNTTITACPAPMPFVGCDDARSFHPLPPLSARTHARDHTLAHSARARVQQLCMSMDALAQLAARSRRSLLKTRARHPCQMFALTRALVRDMHTYAQLLDAETTKIERVRQGLPAEDASAVPAVVAIQEGVLRIGGGDALGPAVGVVADIFGSQQSQAAAQVEPTRLLRAYGDAIALCGVDGRTKFFTQYGPTHSSAAAAALSSRQPRPHTPMEDFLRSPLGVDPALQGLVMGHLKTRVANVIPAALAVCADSLPNAIVRTRAAALDTRGVSPVALALMMARVAAREKDSRTPDLILELNRYSIRQRKGVVRKPLVRRRRHKSLPPPAPSLVVALHTNDSAVDAASSPAAAAGELQVAPSVVTAGTAAPLELGSTVTVRAAGGGAIGGAATVVDVSSKRAMGHGGRLQPHYAPHLHASTVIADPHRHTHTCTPQDDAADVRLTSAPVPEFAVGGEVWLRMLQAHDALLCAAQDS